MTFLDAVQKSVKQFLDGKMPKNLMEIKEGRVKYTPDYFDGFEEMIMEEEKPSKKTKKKKGDLEDEI